MQETNSSTETRRFSTAHWTWFAILIIAGLMLRWLELDTRPIHHDESLHGMYGIYYYDWPIEKYYRYDPMLHGPLLYNLYPLVYYTLGISDWSLRALIAVLGSVLMFVPYLFRQYFKPATFLGLTAAVALSPGLVYWSRFVHHDLLVLIGWIMMLYGATVARDKHRALLVLAGLAIQAVVKANIFITVALILGFMVYEALLAFIWPKTLLPDNLASRTLSWLNRHRFALVFAGFVALLIFFFYYTAGFKYFGAFIPCVPEPAIPDKCNGVHKISEMFTYWLHQDRIERIVGPFVFHFYVLAWYELAFIGAAFIGLYLLYKETSPALRAVGALSIGAGAVFALMFIGEDVPKNFIWKQFKLKDSIDILGLFLLVSQSLIVTTHHLLRKERPLAFFGYFFYATFFCYSFAGEKTPWLAIYPLVTGLAYLALFFQDYFERKPLPCWQEFPISCVIKTIGTVIFILGAAFLVEQQATDFWRWMLAALWFTCAVVLVANIAWLRSACKAYSLRWLLVLMAFSIVFWGLGVNSLWVYLITGIILIGLASIDSMLEPEKLDSLAGRFDILVALVFGVMTLVCLVHSTIRPSQPYSSLMQVLLLNWKWLAAGLVLMGAAQIASALKLLETCNLRTLLFVFLALYTLRASILTNFVFAGHANEFMSQVHTTPEYDGIMKRIRAELLATAEEKRPEVLVYDNCTAVWPSVWYMRRLPLRFQAKKEDRSKYLYIVQDWDDKPQDIPAGYEMRKVKLRGWWVPDYSKMTLRRFLNYSLNHIPWAPGHGGDPSGYTYVALMSRTNR